VGVGVWGCGVGGWAPPPQPPIPNPQFFFNYKKYYIK